MAVEPENRVEEELPIAKRLQTERPNRADKARVVVTFHVEMDLAERRKAAQTPGDLDAATIMRQHVADNYWPDMDPDLAEDFLSGLLQNSMSMEVDVAK